MPTLIGRVDKRGLVIEVRLWPVPEAADALRKAGRVDPLEVAVPALIDTGASRSAIDRLILRPLAPKPSNFVMVHTSNTGQRRERRDTFDIGLAVGSQHEAPLTLALEVIETDLASEGLAVLFGRDALRYCHLNYDGPTGSFNLSY